ncbi:hypothetical protein JCM3765_003549 [Sporobolomyces pararoseus]
MSRQTFGRASLYPVAPPPSHWTALEHCSLQLAQCSMHLQSSIQILDEATRDFPRLASVIESTRVYDLIPSNEIKSAQKALENEMSPQIQELIVRAETGLETLKKRERELQTRVEKRKQYLNPDLPVRTGAREEVELAERRLQELRRKKEQLGLEVEGLEREVETRLAGAKR